MVDDPRHQDAFDRRRVTVAKRCCRPGGNLEQFGAAEFGHRPEFFAAFSALRLAVELGNQVGTAHHVEDRPLATGSERLGWQPDLVP